jgi:Glycosyltransferase family 17
MSPYVDRFVLVESCETFRGAPKPFYFAEHKDRFAAFADKIIYVPVHDRLETDNPWVRERFQRAQIFRGLKQCKSNDIIILSDVDEIVGGASIPDMASRISSGKAQALVCRQKMYYGHMNRFQGIWPGSVCTSYATAKRLKIKNLRRLRNMRKRHLRKTGISRIEAIDQAGWHFTSMGDLNRYIQKIESYSHREADRPEVKTDGHRQGIIQALPLHQIDDSFPQFLRERQAHFEEIGFLETKNFDP